MPPPPVYTAKSRGLIELVSGFFIGNAAVYGFKWIEAARISLIERNNFPVSISPTPLGWITRFVDTVTSKPGKSTCIDIYTEYVIVMSPQPMFRIRLMIFTFVYVCSQPRGKHRWARIGMDRVYVARNVTKRWHRAAIRNTKENLIAIIRVTPLCSGREVSRKWIFRESLRIDNLMLLCFVYFQAFEFPRILSNVLFWTIILVSWTRIVTRNEYFRFEYFFLYFILVYSLNYLFWRWFVRLRAKIRTIF